jgi:predicted RNase H-like nuclease (RuvC/YqgF family)
VYSCGAQVVLGLAILQRSAALLPHRTILPQRQNHQREALSACRRPRGGGVVVHAAPGPVGLVAMDGDGIERKRHEARRLQEMAAEAAAAALAAEERSQQIKTGALQELAALSQRAKKERELERLRKEAESRATEAARLAAQAEEAERRRGTTTLADRLAEKARNEINLADELEGKIAAIENPNGLGLRGAEVPAHELTFQGVSSALKAVRLIPVTSTRSGDVLARSSAG